MNFEVPLQINFFFRCLHFKIPTLRLNEFLQDFLFFFLFHEKYKRQSHKQKPRRGVRSNNSTKTAHKETDRQKTNPNVKTIPQMDEYNKYYKKKR